MSTTYRPDHPAGLPIGEGWVDVDSTAEVRFPYTGELVADAPVGSRERRNKRSRMPLSYVSGWLRPRRTPVVPP